MAPSGDANGQYCLEQHCKHDRREKKPNGHKIPMMQCSFCYKWYHDECVGLKNNDKVLTLWPCFECRAVTTLVKQLHDCIITLTTNVKEIKLSLDESKKLCSDMSEKCDNLIADNTALKTSLTELKADFQRTKTNKCDGCAAASDDDEDEDDEDEDVEPSGTLIIGDSMIRSVESNCKELCITSISGAKVCDIKKTLRKINPKKEKYNDIYIICGTNDSSTKKSADKIAREFRSMLQIVKDKAQNIHLSSIIPRADDKADMTKIDNINQLLTTIANEESVKFINNDVNFKYQDGSIDESLLLTVDKLHLSASGTKKLMQNMKLEQKTKGNSGNKPRNWWKKNDSEVQIDPLPVPNPAPKPNFTQPKEGERERNQHDQPSATPPMYFRGNRNSFSNFYTSPITVWGMNFPTNEHAYNYRKAREMGKTQVAEKIKYAETARKSQLIARNEVQTDDRWKAMKKSVMYELLEHKVKQCTTFRDDLIASQGRQLIEDTTHEYWGRGREGNGQNVLGRLLMTLRDTVVKNNAPTSSRFARPSYEKRSYARNEQQSHCYNCGERSHNVRTCRHPAPLECYSCHRYGHKQKNCTWSR